MENTYLTITVSVPGSLVDDVVAAQKRVNNGEEKDENAAYLVAGEWLQESLEGQMSIAEAILDAKNVRY